MERIVVTMKAIFKRELNAYFTSALGYAYLFLFLFFDGIVFFATSIILGRSTLSLYFQGIAFLSPLFLPLLTVRIFAEDKKLKTDQLLLTAPVSTTGMVLGKFFAAFAVFGIGLAVTIIYPLIQSRYGAVPVAETVCEYIGFILFAALILAVGAFISSMTENQITAVAITYVVIFAVVVVAINGFGADRIPNETVANAVLWLSPIHRFLNLLHGRFNISDAVYLASVSGLFLFLTVETFEKRRLD